MTALFHSFLKDESGLILSAELVVILTIGVIGMVVGLVNLQNALLGEFADLSLAFQSLNQSYSTPSYRGCWKWWGGRTSWVAGSRFIDIFDGCIGSGPVGYNGCEIGAMDYYSTSGTCPVITGQEVVTPSTVLPNTVQPIPQGTTLTPPGTPCQGCQ